MRKITVAILGLILAACAPQTPAPAPEAGARGKRVVSMSPSATLVAQQIGGIDSFVGVSTYDALSLPAELKDLPIVGDYEKVNIELLTRLKPTSVVVFSSPEKLPAPLRQQAEQKTFELVSLPFDTFDDLWKNAADLGRLTGRDDAAKEKIAEAKGKIAAVEKKISGVKEKPRVLFVVSTTGRIAAEGSDIFFDDIIKIAGGINAAAEVGRRWVEINKETCIRLKPDVVIISAPGEPPAQVGDERIEKWKNMDIPAAKSGRIHLWTDPDGQMLSLNAAAMVQKMAEALHPALTKPTPFDELPTQPATGRGEP